MFYRASSTTLNKENISLAVQIDRKYFPCVHDDTLDYLSILKHSGFKFPFKNSTHHGEDGHVFFADYLYKEMKRFMIYNTLISFGLLEGSNGTMSSAVMDLAIQLEKEGQKKPFVVYVNKHKQFKLVSGDTRYQAYKYVLKNLIILKFHAS